ncbi:hypothetical protein GOC14_20475 [Sinorhizobium meliloti]|nr:hypothetical protein [Sinorhizobium meliloti]
MTTTKKAIDALVAHAGFDPARCRAVARKLTDAGILPMGGPRKSPELEVWHFIDLLVGVSLDVPLRAIPETVSAYRELAPGAADMSGAPEHLRKSAGDYLDVLAEIAANGAADARQDIAGAQIEIVSTWPEISIRDARRTHRFQPVGTLPDHWQGTKQRRAVTVNGSAFVRAIRTAFKGE